MAAEKNTRPEARKVSKPPRTGADLERAMGEVQKRLRSDDPGGVNAIVEDWSIEDLTDLVTHMPMGNARTFLDWLPRRKAGRVLARMHPDHRATLSRNYSEGTLGELLGEMPWDKALDTLRALPRRTRERVAGKLKGFDSTSSVADFSPGTAGRVMERRFVAVPGTIPASEAITRIRESFEATGAVGTVYVVDEGDSLVGMFRPRDLLAVSPDTLVSDLMQTSFPVVNPGTSQAVAAHMVEGTGYMSLPVVDAEGKLVGQISPKLRERILSEEHRRDLLGMSQVSPDSRATDGFRQIIRGRLPWLLAGLIGATVAAFVIGSFEEELEKAAILAAFIPVVMSMAGNSGLQAAGVSVQVLASGAAWPGDRLSLRLLRELAGALSNGAIAGVILASLVMLSSMFFEIENAPRLALATSLSLMSVTSIAALVGASVPFALDRFGIDPAAATGVFITTSNDVVGVIVYFTMADLFYF